MTLINFQKELNEAQYNVVTSGKGPHLVLAGAGSGKTRTLVYRVAWLISQGVSPDRILLLTFTNKAANEMMFRVKSILGFSESQKLPLWGGTFHSVANRLIRMYGKEIGIKPNFTILDAEDSRALIKNVAKQYLSGLSEKHRPSPAILQETISFAINSGIEIAESLEIKFSEWQGLQTEFEKITTSYQKQKRDSNLLDFDDLLVFWKMLTEHPKIGQKLQKMWEYILVDEYQDTNTLQAQIIYNLSRVHQNILVVGDDAQSIYSFRAADIQNILDFPKIFSGCRVHKLETNYRSTPEILNLANQVIAQNLKQFPKNLKALKDNFIRPEIAAVRTTLEEAWYIAGLIGQFLSQGYEHHQIAVLFRASHHSQALEMELNRRGIKYEMRGGLKFFERAHVKDVVAWLKILSNYQDIVSWTRILELYEGIGPQTAAKIFNKISQADNLAKLPKIDLSDRAKKSYAEISQILDKLYRHKKNNIGQLIDIILENYHDFLKSKYTDYRSRQEDLDQLASFATTYDNLDVFLAEVALQTSTTEAQESDSKADNVILSTIHQAKGLEWPVVFVMNLTDQAFPHPLAVTEDEQEEERRLFYVAITRAMQYLYLVYPLTQFKYDGYRTLKPSIFVSQVDSALLQYNDLARSTISSAEDNIEYIADGDFLPKVDDW